MDWFKYGNNYGTTNATTNSWATVNSNSNVNIHYTGVNFYDEMDGVVADVTDSYKELSSERIE